MLKTRFLLLACTVLIAAGLAAAQALITLSPASSPAAGQPGVTSINVTGSNFPNGIIVPADVSVQLQAATSGPTGTTVATAITTITGSARRVTFVIPSSLTVTSPAAYLVSISGKTTTGETFTSSNKANLTINPPA